MRALTLSISPRPRTPRAFPRLVRATLRAAALLPVAIRIEWLRWLQREMGPLHPCAGEIVTERAELEAARLQGSRAGLRTLGRQLWRRG